MSVEVALERIRLTAQAGAIELNLSGLGLTELPEELFSLTDLQELNLDSNQLTSLPEDFARLTNLQRLVLRNNQLTSLPEDFARLTNLQSLDLDSNQLTSLPEDFARLTNLQSLFLSSNQLTSLQEDFEALEKLSEFSIDGNPLVSPPLEILAQGLEEIMAFLRAQKTGRREWISKLLVVGEGGTGKTQLLRALRGENFDEDIPTTHGIEIRPVMIPHPSKADVTMKLNAWDFGGQEIYHATHQFFLSSRSLFILTWNARLGPEQGRLEYWLDMIQARAPQSPVLLVATHIDERHPDLDLTDLQKRYPFVVGQCEFSNSTRAGFNELKAAVANTAAGLPLMGERWPADWLSAAEELRELQQRHITPAEMTVIFQRHGVTGLNCSVLSRWLHELGDILHFCDDEELRDIVIVKPQWVSNLISRVLDDEDKEIADKKGVFTRAKMNAVWSELDPTMRNLFLRLMEKFDLSYRTHEHGDISLVVELLPHDPGDYETEWNAVLNTPGCKEITLKYELNTVPPGIPTWFIARTHRFSIDRHWRAGVLFGDARERDQRRHLGLVQVSKHERLIRLIARGPNPHNFFALLRDGLDVTLARYPGLKITRKVPCPGHDGKDCSFEFELENLERAAERRPPVQFVQCQRSFEDVSVTELLFGFHSSANAEIIRRLDALKTMELEHHQELLEQNRELAAMVQRDFLKQFRAMQSHHDSGVPNVFLLRRLEGSKFVEKTARIKVGLQLYCQEPGCWHPPSSRTTATGETQPGYYEIDVPAAWLRAIAPYAAQVAKYAKYVVPLIGPALGMYFGSTAAKAFESDMRFSSELSKALPEITGEGDDERFGRGFRGMDGPERVEGEALRQFREVLREVDPHLAKSGLRRVLTPEGTYLWLCDDHAGQYRL